MTEPESELLLDVTRREYRIVFTRLAGRSGDRLARRADSIPSLEISGPPMEDNEIAEAVRRHLAGHIRRTAEVTMRPDHNHGVVTRPGRRDGPPVAVVEFHVMWRFPVKRPRGRPPVGPMTSLRLTPELRAALDAARRPGEGVAEVARRLLGVAVDPLLPDVLALAVHVWDHGARDRADAARALLAELADTQGDGPQ
jgi:hypothetical protein